MSKANSSWKKRNEGNSYKRGATQLEDILPPSPEAASRVKYADVPFTHCTGAAEYSVPIYEMKGRRLTIPINLDYCSNGIKAKAKGKDTE